MSLSVSKVFPSLEGGGVASEARRESWRPSESRCTSRSREAVDVVDVMQSESSVPEVVPDSEAGDANNTVAEWQMRLEGDEKMIEVRPSWSLPSLSGESLVCWESMSGAGHKSRFIVERDICLRIERLEGVGRPEGSRKSQVFTTSDVMVSDEDVVGCVPNGAVNWERSSPEVSNSETEVTVVVESDVIPRMAEGCSSRRAPTKHRSDLTNVDVGDGGKGSCGCWIGG